ncbi:fimbrial protein [Klebsiella sp. RHBSTW-00484]|uniref:fimbrial protein n=1 Tax=unclassified Klebsiella TaxID=2608929 RepID=UPI0015E4A4C6|nr:MULTISPECIES: fimbrial protein [unclassified Klebsiella]MBA7846489.1 fimbrial protein [Klebsiella sp. RHBSTW-00465]QLO37623.1 fimbrial protein [Klebsiella sp. RHBSTW-00484]QLT77141.1 fimbrial protein [Klebsiella sp. RHBSTW-00464]
MNIARYLILLALFSLTIDANADCQVVNGWQNRPLIFNFPNQFVVPNSLPMGSVFYETKVSENHNGEQYATCPAGSNRGVKYINGWATDGNGIAPTNVPGVGIRIHWLYPTGGSVLVPKDPYDVVQRNDTHLIWHGGPEWQVELIKTGPISAGALQTGTYVVYGVGNHYVSELRVMGGGRIVIPTCTLLSSTVDVPLGKHLKSEFSGPGSATPWQPFNIPLSCDKDAKINVRIDADADVSSTPGVMTLDSQPGDMAATGVGIQLWYQPNGGSAVVFGRETYYYTSIYGGNEVVKLKARYYQTGSRVIAGIANGTATFTITYN